MASPRAWAVCTVCCAVHPSEIRCPACAGHAPLRPRTPTSRAPREVPRLDRSDPRQLRSRGARLELYALTLTIGLVAATVFAILGIR